MPDNNNLTEINKVFNNLNAKIVPDKPFMAAIANIMHDNVVHNFQTEGRDVVPGGWKL